VIALASARLGPRADRLDEAAGEALAAGFRRVFASVPPGDDAAARKAIGVAGLALDGVSSAPVETLAGVPPAIDAAATAAAALRTRLVVIDAAALPAGAAPEADLERLSRALFDATRRHAGAAIAVRVGARGNALLALAAVEALLSDLATKPVAVVLDPARAPDPALWAERLGRRTAGVVLAVSDGTGGVDWGTLRGSLPSRAVRVLEAPPSASAAEVVAARRRFEESLGF
jgi:hypothetical protein